jgi:hypothetical protein
MLSDLENFVIPKNFLAIEIVKPEVFSISSLKSSSLVEDDGFIK